MREIVLRHAIRVSRVDSCVFAIRVHDPCLREHVSTAVPEAILCYLEAVFLDFLVCGQAKLNELRNTLQSRDEMLHVKNEAENLAASHR